ncbi:MAG TPA: phosphate/phosphite/phosphonate ABC transporter substrate-binding protein [Firmicutes bacterium]|nr:phosphate/phosphite/phosphonate ABC transporter substrate-binding protein [Bacillota bacterium]
MRKNLLLLICTFIITLFLPCCPRHEKPQHIDSSELLKESPRDIDSYTLVFGVFCFETASDLFIRFKPFTDYLTEQTGEQVQLRLFNSNNELFNSLKRKEIDIALISDAMYSILLLNKIEDYSVAGIPVSQNSEKYRCNVIVRKDSVISEFRDLKGKSFALLDKFSVSGYYYPVELTLYLGMRPEDFFSNVIVADNYHDLINHILTRRVSGVCIPSYYLDPTAGSGLKGKVKVIKTSDVFLKGPVIIKASLDDGLKMKINEVLFSMDSTEEGLNVLKQMNVDKFVKGSSGDYLTTLELVRKYYEFE